MMETLRIGTYNLRRATLDAASEENNWTLREPRLITSLLRCSFDLCGVQEVDTDEQESIPRRLKEAGKEYGSFFFGPYDENGVGTKAHGLLWKKDRFTVGEPHHFWISRPPEVMQVNDHGSNPKGEFIRGGFCVAVEDLKHPGKKFFMMVTHAPLNREDHAENAPVFLEMEERFNPTGLPSFFVGDFNARETDRCSALYRTRWTDTYHAFDGNPSLREGPYATFNGWNKELPADCPDRIDFIYFRGRGVRPLKYVCDDTRYGGLYASDHFPVYADFEIES